MSSTTAIYADYILKEEREMGKGGVGKQMPGQSYIAIPTKLS